MPILSVCLRVAESCGGCLFVTAVMVVESRYCEELDMVSSQTHGADQAHNERREMI